MSGGQLQRIALARALYKTPKILILDESTNALDNITENKVLENLNSSNLFDILIIISHKASSLKFCNKILNLKIKTLLRENMNNKIITVIGLGYVGLKLLRWKKVKNLRL